MINLPLNLNDKHIFVYKTDTVWGIGAVATRLENYICLAKVKKRIHNQNFILLMKDIGMVYKYFPKITLKEQNLLLKSPVPTTVLLKSTLQLPTPQKWIGIRLPKNNICKTLLNYFDKPILSSSANFHGGPTPQCFSEINPLIIKEVDFVFGDTKDIPSKVQASRIIRVLGDDNIEIIRH